MLGRKRKLVEDAGYALDVAAGVILLFGSYLFFRHFEREWEAFLHQVTGYPFNIQSVAHLKDQGWLFLVIVLNFSLTLRTVGPYPLDLGEPAWLVAWKVLRAVGAGLGATALFFYFFAIVDVNRSLLFGFSMVYLGYLWGKEVVMRRWLLEVHLRRRPLEALVVGPASTLREQLAELADPSREPIEIKAILLTEGSIAEVDPKWRSRVVGPLEELSSILADQRVDVVFLKETRNGAAAQAVLAAAEEQGIEVWYFAGLLSGPISRPQFDEYAGHPVIVFKSTSHYEGRLMVKRAFDAAITLLLVVLLAPVFVVCAVLIKLTSPGPVFFVQERTGWRGRPFRMFKFRTMVVGAESRRDELLRVNEMSGPVFKSSDDPRLTAVGRTLRRYSLDELPQLFNVLRGEMSLVGPRPLPVYETRAFAAFRDHRRYTVLPGLTGLWQVSGRSTITDFSEWVRLDLEYIDRWSLWLDVKILVRTIPVVLSGQGAR